MKISRTKVREKVIQCLLNIVDSKSEVVIESSTDPINQLGLDSMDGIYYALEISDKLMIELPDTLNPLVDDERHKPRNVNEIVELIHNIIENKEKEAIYAWFWQNKAKCC